MRRSDREISEIQGIEEIIQKSDVCRIALANENIPYIENKPCFFIAPGKGKNWT